MEKVSVSIQGENVLVINGNIASLDDYVTIRDGINSVLDRGVKSVTIKIVDSKTIMSSLIGFLMKLVNHDKVSINLEVSSQELYKSLSTMKLIEVFNTRKI
ncbi:MAG: hypothetical protein LDL13_03730 [Calditerrivibrio sp.]|nr:hypothetical protein [Calditerrivibrio sp.]